METKIFDNKKIIIRKLLVRDLKNVKEFQKYINSLVEEEAKILINQKKTLKEEKEWLRKNLKEVRNKKRVMLLAQYKNEIVGGGAVWLRRERESHVGEFAISIKSGFRGIGLGKYLMGEILKSAKKELKPKIFRLSVFPNNKIAINLYKKFGFKIIARIPKQEKWKGKLIDEIVMLKFL